MAWHSSTYREWSTVAPVTVANPPTVNGYVVRLTVPYSVDMQADFADLRFASTTDAPLPYGIEAKTDSVSAEVSIRVSASTIAFWLVYGNPDAVSESDLSAVYLYRDDFADGVIGAGWNVAGLGSAVESGGNLTTTGAASTWNAWDTAAAYRSVAVPANFEAEATVSIDAVSSSLAEIYLQLWGTGVEIHAGAKDSWGDGTPGFQAYCADTDYNSGKSSRAEPYTVRITIRRLSGVVAFYEDGTLRATGNDAGTLTRLGLVHTRYPAYVGHTATWSYVWIRPLQAAEPILTIGDAVANPIADPVAGPTYRPLDGLALYPDRFGYGCFGRRTRAPIIIPPTFYPDRFGYGCFGRRSGAPFVPTGRALVQTCYLAIGRLGASGTVTYTQAGEIAPDAAIVLPRLRAPVVYVLDELRRPLGVIDGYESFFWEERWREPDEWALVVNKNVAGALTLKDGVFVASPMPDGRTLVGIIEGRGIVLAGHEDTELITATGRDYGATLEGHIAIRETREGDGYDTWTPTRGTAADAMAWYVERNALDAAALGERVVPDLAIGTIPATAETVKYGARFQPLTEILAEIGLATGLGWQVRYDAAGNRFLFEPVTGRDMTAEVAFSPEFGNVASIGVSHDTRNERSIAWVAGQGEAADRIVQPYYDPARFPAGVPTGLAYREVFVDARDIDPEDEDALGTRGLAKLAEAGPEQSIEFALLDGGAYDYPADFRLGDVVRVEYPEWAYEEARIVVVAQRWDRAGRTVAVTVGQEPKDVGAVIVGMARRQGVRSRV